MFPGVTPLSLFFFVSLTCRRDRHCRCCSSSRLATSDSAVPTQDPATFDISEIYLPSFSTFSETALTMFRAMFGDFDFDEFSGVR